MYFSNKIVLITGASSGIGEALAYDFARQNSTVLLCARNERELQRVKESMASPCEYVVCDITDYAAVDAMVDYILKKYGRVDVLVNNAGISQRGLVYETDYSVDERIMRLNFLSAVYLTKKLLPGMVARKSGDIIVISSVSGKFGFWQRSAYAASKHALQGFFETLQIELRPFHIHTLIVSPGGVKTNISKNALSSDGTPHGKLDDLQKRGMTAEALSRKIIAAAAAHKRQLLAGSGEVYLYYIKKWIPRLFFKIARHVKGR